MQDFSSASEEVGNMNVSILLGLSSLTPSIIGRLIFLL